MAYQVMNDGEWFELERRWNLSCCDCRLVHRVAIRVRADRVEISLTRDRRATAQRRRRLPKKLANSLKRLLISPKEVALAQKPKATKKSKARRPKPKPVTQRSATKPKAAPKAKARKPAARRKAA